MLRPFRFGVTVAHASSRTAWVTIAHRVEELGYGISYLQISAGQVENFAPVVARLVGK